MKMLLRDAAGAREFINNAIDAAETIAIAMVGQPDEMVLAHLEVTRANLKRDLTPELGPETAAEFADIFCRAVIGEKHEREAVLAAPVSINRSI
jgi:hypothetical protein